MWLTPETILVSIFHDIRHNSSLSINTVSYQLQTTQSVPVMKDEGSHPSQDSTLVSHYFVVSFATICK
jgi:hypothetical protein